MKKGLVIIAICLPLLFACGAKETTPASENTSGSENLVGSDRDNHGCIGSAGYSWCERTRQCERPWELAQREGFENTQEAFTAFCQDSGE